MQRPALAGEPVVLRFDGITKRFGNVIASDNVSFEVRRGEIVALLGENGAGKTTLMSILFGHYRADAGHIEVFGRRLPPGSPKAALSAGVGMVHQHFALAPNLSVLDNLMLGSEPLYRLRSRRGEARRKLQALAGEFEFQVDLNTLVADLSVGERQRVEILKVLYRDARILILDEPTAVLSPQESAALFELLRKLAARGGTVIFISHKLHEVVAVAHRVVVMRQGRIVADRPASGASSRELAELMVGRTLKPTLLPPTTPGRVILEFNDVHVTRQDGLVGLASACLKVASHQILGIAGVSGNGQSELSALLEGMISPASGTVTIQGAALTRFRPDAMLALNVGRIPEDRQRTGVVGTLPLWENAVLEQYRSPSFSRHGWRRLAESREHGSRLIQQYDIRCSGAEARTASLSGGNMQKVILGRVLSREPSLIVASHPTRGLDVGAIEYVHEQLIEARAAGAAILLISDDLDEIMALSDQVVVMHRGRTSRTFDRASIDIEEVGLAMTGGTSRAH